MAQPSANNLQSDARARQGGRSRLGLVPATRVLDRPVAHGRAPRLRAVILLAGTLRPGLLQQAAGRLLLELPVEPGRSALDVWHEQVRRLGHHLHLDRLPMRVLIDHQARRTGCHGRAIGEDQFGEGHDPATAPSIAPLTIERDPVALRGTGGLLRDVVAEYAADEHVLVADAGRLLFEPLWLLYARLARTPGDIRLLAGADGSPAGLMLLRAGCLRDLPGVGFVDFKEQALPRLATTQEVRVARWRRDPGTPLRTLAGYLQAVRCWQGRAASHGPGAVEGASPSAATNAWSTPFAVVEPGAQVDRTAWVHDTVVLAGGRVEAGATVVRCVVGPNGRVRAGRARVNALIASRTRQWRASPPWSG